ARVGAQARPAHPSPQPGDVRGRDRRADHHRRLADPGVRRQAAGRRARARLVHLLDHGLAVAHGRLRQPRRGARRGPPPRPGGWPRGASLRAMRPETAAKLRDGGEKPASELARGDVVVVVAGETIPGDGTVIEGIASVDESAITGESAPVIREAGGDRSAVTGGTKVLSDRIVVEIT